MKDETLKELLEEYLTGTITKNGKTELARLIDQPEYREKLETLMEKTFRSEAFVNEENEKLRSEIQNWLKERIGETEGAKTVALESAVKKKSSLIWLRKWQTYAAAASVIIMTSVFVYIWQGKKPNGTTSPAPTVAKVNDVTPGSFKAKLTLSDNREIILDSVTDKVLLEKEGIRVVNKDGKLVYEQKGKETKALYNTLTTAKGETYMTVLADGTKVWLNSESSIRYLVPFEGNERRVEVKGEAYFDVAHDASKPFHAIQNGMDMQVLGTEFNVNGYSDEPEMRTTLLRGKVKVMKGNSVTVLLPGEQARFNKQTQQLEKLDNVDVDEVVAWKNGYFQFNDADLQTMLRQIVRWYDVEIELNGTIPQRKFTGKIPRASSLSQVLEALETLESFKEKQVHFRLEGKKIIVTP